MYMHKNIFKYLDMKLGNNSINQSRKKIFFFIQTHETSSYFLSTNDGFAKLGVVTEDVK